MKISSLKSIDTAVLYIFTKFVMPMLVLGAVFTLSSLLYNLHDYENFMSMQPYYLYALGFPFSILLVFSITSYTIEAMIKNKIKKDFVVSK